MNDFERDTRYILNTYKRINLNITHGKGSYVYNEAGRAYLDMYAGIAVSSLGHRHPKINQAIKKQLNKHLHLSNYFVSKPVVDLAEGLVKSSFADQVFFTNSGTEAVEASIKLVRKYGKEINEEKTEIVTLNQSFHGRTMGALALTGQLKYQSAFGPMLEGIKHIERNNILQLEEVITHKTCAIYLEMIQGEGGIELLTEEFVEAIIRLSTLHHVLIAVDEIQTGLLRTGKLFSYMYTSLTPDVMTLAKSLGGGLPLGALLVSRKLTHVLKPGDHGTTFGGNPLAAAAGLAAFKLLSSEKMGIEVKEKSDYFYKKLVELKNKYPLIKDVRGKGFMLGIDVGDYAKLIVGFAFEKQVLLNVTNQTVIRLLPPLNIKLKELNQFLDVFEEILNKIKISPS